MQPLFERMVVAERHLLHVTSRTDMVQHGQFAICALAHSHQFTLDDVMFEGVNWRYRIPEVWSLARAYAAVVVGVLDEEVALLLKRLGTGSEVLTGVVLCSLFQIDDCLSRDRI